MAKKNHYLNKAKRAKSAGDKYRQMSLNYAGGGNVCPKDVTKELSKPTKLNKPPKVKKPKKKKDLGLVGKLLALPVSARLDYLRAQEKGCNASAKYIKKARKEFELIKHKLIKIQGLCMCCNVEAAAHRHHVLPIKKNGTNTKNNLALICERCHELIHPFMVQYKKVASRDSVQPELQNTQN